MKPFLFVCLVAVSAILLGGCLTSEEQEQQTEQRQYDIIIKKNRQMIDRNQKMLDQQNQ
ncbi:MAG TPA: hypothetical protein VMA13_00540 [Candidatus Saccharimonadales bacterium]|nr:hypothetical protein [Candidatus Saccharimonadales bacterium]